ncbi:MAG: hypothetical protein ABW068_16325, partial [Candidatus Thiodiazotropha sp.]
MRLEYRAVNRLPRAPRKRAQKRSAACCPPSRTDAKRHDDRPDASTHRRSRPKRVFDLMKDFGTSKSTKIDSIFDSLLVPR